MVFRKIAGIAGVVRLEGPSVSIPPASNPNQYVPNAFGQGRGFASRKQPQQITSAPIGPTAATYWRTQGHPRVANAIGWVEDKVDDIGTGISNAYDPPRAAR